MAQKVDTERKYSLWIDLIAGSFGGSIAKSILSPFQRIVVLQQLGQHKKYTVWQLALHIYQHEGLKGFWRGNFTSMIIRVPYSGLQFVLYNRIKFFIEDWVNRDWTAHLATEEIVGVSCERIHRLSMVDKFFIKCGAGGVSAIIASAVVYPGEVVRLRLMSGEKKFNGLLNTSCLIYRETNSLRNFYRGFAASSVQRVPDILVCFATYETVKYALLDNANSLILGSNCALRNTVSTVLGGSLAALASIAITFPLDVVKRRIGMSGQSSDKIFYTGIGNCLREVYYREGIRGLYAGSFMEAVRCVPQVVMMWFFIENIQSRLSERLNG